MDRSNSSVVVADGENKFSIQYGDKVEGDKVMGDKVQGDKYVISKPEEHPPYGEPSETEMKNALLAAVTMRGGTQKGENSIAAENAIAGMAMEILEFEKLGCKPATHGAGYFCNYKHTSRMGAYSNEGTSAGDKHAQGVNILLSLFMGGRDAVTGTATRRFLKSKDGWISSEE